MDYDYFSGADVVDRFSVNKMNVMPTPWMESAKWNTISLGGGGHPSTMTLKYSVQCNANYYGPNCTKYCIAHDDDDAGHYTCDKTTGHKVCRTGSVRGISISGYMMTSLKMASWTSVGKSAFASLFRPYCFSPFFLSHETKRDC